MLVARDTFPPPFAFAVFICGGPPFSEKAIRDERHLRYYENGLDRGGNPVITVPTVHLLGAQDKDLAECMKLVHLCREDARQFFEHPAGHEIPTASKDITNKMVETIQRGIEKAIRAHLKWEINATGHIAGVSFNHVVYLNSYCLRDCTDFVRDLLTDPGIRGVHDLRHEVVASSTSAQKAADFCAKVQHPPKTRTYASYAELVADPEVAIVYVATSQSHHFQNVMLALEANKHVLCEKAFTVTAAQARTLVDTARARKLFLMEAVWNRFFHPQRQGPGVGLFGSHWDCVPCYCSINRSLPDGKLEYNEPSRVVNPDLAGGAMLELGIYSFTWIMQILHHLQPEEEKEAPAVVTAAMNKYHTGVDETTSFIVQFPRHKAMGIGMTTMRVGSGGWRAMPYP
ncbi:hypothetical protein DL770_002343 [Monosporascus sp. CRB-9-2]|nr:hypothetical protein DL770_002343 [Monosporascus sp. CRB-9-2]